MPFLLAVHGVIIEKPDLWLEDGATWQMLEATSIRASTRAQTYVLAIVREALTIRQAHGRQFAKIG